MDITMETAREMEKVSNAKKDRTYTFKGRDVSLAIAVTHSPDRVLWLSGEAGGMKIMLRLFRAEVIESDRGGCVLTAETDGGSFIDLPIEG